MPLAVLGMARFCKFLHCYSLHYVQVLDFEQSGLGDRGAHALAEALSSNGTLRRLRLGQCNITAVGLRQLSKSLCDNRVTPLHLHRLELVCTRERLIQEGDLCVMPLACSPAEYKLHPSRGKPFQRQWCKVSCIREWSHRCAG